MKTQKQIERDAQTSLNKVRVISQRVEFETAKRFSELTRIDLANLRNDVNEIAQRFHEFNALLNVLGLPLPESE